MGKVEVLDVAIDKVDMGAAIQQVEELIRLQTPHLVVTPNSEMIVRAQKDKSLKRILNQADLVLPDGAGVVLASKLMREPLPARVAGIDLMVNLLSVAAQKGYQVYFLGARPGITEQVKERFLFKYPNLKVVGTHHGYLDEESEARVIEEINHLQPDLLFVGMGVPLQEKWLNENLTRLGVPVSIGIGGSFDVLAGIKQRAPGWMQRLNLEWFYRLLQEPDRFIRMLALPKFVFLVLIKEFLN